MRRLVLLAVMVLSVAGCAQPDSPPGGPGPSATGTVAGEWELRYLLLDRYPDFAYCDPDFYPVARDDEQAAADDWWAGADRSSPEVRAILAERGYREPLTADQRLAAYRDHKVLSVITMAAVAGGYAFELSTSTSGGEPDETVAGVVNSGGAVSESSRQPRVGGCPICLEAATRIATPDGDRPVAVIRPGDLVWTVDTTGERVAAPVERTRRRATVGPHLLLRIVLSDGRVLVAAGAHPASDGRYLRQLRPGEAYDGSVVATVGWTLSVAPATFDILPAGPTATYWADGILVGSTLKP